MAETRARRFSAFLGVAALLMCVSACSVPAQEDSTTEPDRLTTSDAVAASDADSDGTVSSEGANNSSSGPSLSANASALVGRWQHNGWDVWADGHREYDKYGTDTVWEFRADGTCINLNGGVSTWSEYGEDQLWIRDELVQAYPTYKVNGDILLLSFGSRPISFFGEFERIE